MESATVDEKKTMLKVAEELRLLIEESEAENGFNPTDFGNSVTITFQEAKEVYHAIYTALHSQQPTVDADALVDTLWRKHSHHIDSEDQIMLPADFERAIQEVLQGSYTRSDLANFANMISLADDGEKFEENAMNDLLTQYDTERGMKNG